MWCWWWLVLAVLGAAARAQSPRPVCNARHCYGLVHSKDSYHFFVVGTLIKYQFIDGDYFALDCGSGTPLDEPALPRFIPALRVREVQLTNCRPRAGSYAAALRALNVTALDPPAPGNDPDTPTYPMHVLLKRLEKFNASMLADMPALRNLSIYDTRVTAAELELLPVGLERLALRYTKTGRVPAAALSRLPRLEKVVVLNREPVLVEVEAARNLSSLYINSSATLVSLSLPDTLSSLKLGHWAEQLPDPWRSCVGLDQLVLFRPAAEVLPDGWLARCARLRTLQLRGAGKLKTLSVGALRGASALEVVRVRESALEALPVGLYHVVPALRVLDLSNNTALDACPRAGDTEHDTQESLLRDLSNLSELILSGTRTSRVCADWRRLPRLHTLHLEDTPITHINYTDMQFNSTVDLEVILPAVNLSLRREEYASLAVAPAGPTVTLQLSGLLRCDCELYWAAAALRLPDKRLREVGGSCTDGRALRDVPLDELVCVALGACPEGCTCHVLIDGERPGRVLRLDCAGAGLRRVPRVDARAVLQDTGGEPVALDLRLAGNHIDQLAPEDLPHELAALELTNNALSVIDAATAARLVSRADRRVLLAGNPLNCSCRAAAALSAMREHRDVFRDWGEATCSDGKLLFRAAPLLCDDDTTSKPDSTTKGVPEYTTTIPEPGSVAEDVTRGVPWGVSGGAGAALVLGAAGVGALLWRAVRRRRRAARRARLPETLRLERLDAGEWVYDAFVSFAHADEAVVRELVARLEGGAAPLRLCVHYRDWMPGGWIPAQIAASVRVSRRTVAVVSEAFLRSKWARLEFREAYAAAMEAGEPRLVLVLLEDPARLPLDAELRVCVEGSTYVRWGDPWFWEKLQRALPPPMARPVSESPATPPASPPGAPATSPSPPLGPV